MSILRTIRIILFLILFCIYPLYAADDEPVLSAYQFTLKMVQAEANRTLQDIRIVPNKDSGNKNPNEIQLKIEGHWYEFGTIATLPEGTLIYNWSTPEKTKNWLGNGGVTEKMMEEQLYVFGEQHNRTGEGVYGSTNPLAWAKLDTLKPKWGRVTPSDKPDLLVMVLPKPAQVLVRSFTGGEQLIEPAPELRTSPLSNNPNTIRIARLWERLRSMGISGVEYSTKVYDRSSTDGPSYIFFDSNYTGDIRRVPIVKNSLLGMNPREAIAKIEKIAAYTSPKVKAPFSTSKICVEAVKNVTVAGLKGRPGH